MEILKVYWNYESEKWNLVESDINPNRTKQYVIPKKTIDPSESRLVRIAYKINLFFKNNLNIRL